MNRQKNVSSNYMFQKILDPIVFTYLGGAQDLLGMAVHTFKNVLEATGPTPFSWYKDYYIDGQNTQFCQ